MRELLDLITEEEINATIVALQEELIVWKTLRAVRRVIADPRQPKAHEQARKLLAVISPPEQARKPATCGVGTGNGERNQQRRAEVIECLKRSSRPLSTQEVADALGKMYTTAYGLLNAMHARGEIARNVFGRWSTRNDEVVQSDNAHESAVG